MFATRNALRNSFSLARQLNQCQFSSAAQVRMRVLVRDTSLGTGSCAHVLTAVRPSLSAGRKGSGVEDFLKTLLRASISTGPQQQHSTFYEFRTYQIKPEHNTAFLKLINEKIHLRTAHSELLGFWTVEYGGYNQVFHIWKYDSYTHKAAVRAAVASDPQWTEQCLSKVLPMLSSQDLEATYLIPWCKIEKPPKKGVYELVTFQMKPGGPAVWGKAFQAAVSTHAETGYSHLVGAFHSEFGPLNRVHILWWYESPDHRAAVRHMAHQDARVVGAVRESVSYLESQRNKLLFPTSFSPLQ